jgi:Holliday junction resolvasome RuvABC DNA-binding subunit
MERTVNLDGQRLKQSVPASTASRSLPQDGPAPNPEVARCLDEIGALLEQQGASPFRAGAYRNAAAMVRALPVSVASLYQDGGLEELERIPGVGPSIARAIRDVVLTGRLPMLQRLRGASDPEQLFETLPGVGPHLAERLHQELGLTTLEDLEIAANDGRLGALPGFGTRRVAAIIDALSHRLGRVRGQMPSSTPPPVGELIDVDREYREAAKAGRLPKIAPRRFNPERLAWLPVLHTSRGLRHYTALFSNTARAHQLGRTHDWVVIYCDGDREEHQGTLVTARTGPLSGHRVVRGREPECIEFYRRQSRARQPRLEGAAP